MLMFIELPVYYCST